jgi:hypothetical protein
MFCENKKGFIRNSFYIVGRNFHNERDRRFSFSMISSEKERAGAPTGLL